MLRVSVKTLLILSLLALAHSAAWGDEALFYPGASVERYNESLERRVSVYLSAPKRVSNALRFESEMQLVGVEKTWLLKLDDSLSLSEVLAFYQDIFEERGELLFLCEQRACGTSTNWANRVFSTAVLSGRDDNQYYMSGNLGIDGSQHWLSVYVVRNGRKHNYVYLQLVRPVAELENELSLSGKLISSSGLQRPSYEQISKEVLSSQGKHLLVQVFYLPKDSYSRAKRDASIVIDSVVEALQEISGLEPSQFTVLDSGPSSEAAVVDDTNPVVRFQLVRP